MLEKLVQLERYKSEHRYYGVFKVVDSEFESGEYTLLDQDCVRERLLIHEYTQRCLNVCVNLKAHYSMMLKGRGIDDAIAAIDYDMSVISSGYPYLNFETYYPCIKRHLERMLFAGTIRKGRRR